MNPQTEVKPQHTPTPWKLFQDEDNENLVNIVPQYWPVKGDSVARCKIEEDAAFIVRAVNCHEELVAWVKQFVEDFGEDLKTPVRLYVKELLAKAEGK